jgi:hypothetical protein
MSKLAIILICAVLGVAALGGQGYRDRGLLSASRAETAAARAAQVTAEAAQAADDDRDAKISAAAIEVLRQFTRLKTAADFCRM